MTIIFILLPRYFQSTSNVPYKMPYGVLVGQTLLRITTDSNNLWERISMLYNDYKRNGFNNILIIKHIMHCLHVHENKAKMIIKNYNRKEIVRKALQLKS